jgi:spermidine/putrescine transport system substrate-binding protein
VQAPVVEYINYISPVPAARAVVEADAAKAKGADRDYLHSVATSFATFPDEATYAKVHPYFTPQAGKQMDTWNSIFEPVYQS